EYRRPKHQPDGSRLRGHRSDGADEHPPLSTGQYDHREWKAELRLDRHDAECRASEIRSATLESQPTQPECSQDDDADLAIEDETEEWRERGCGSEHER